MLGWAAAVLLAAGAGFGAAQLIWPPRPVQEAADLDDIMARHLGVIENKGLYEVGDDLEFLRALDHPDLFGDDSD